MLSVQEYEYRRLWHSNVTLGNTVDWLSKDSTTHLMGRTMQKRVFKYMRTENAQTIVCLSWGFTAQSTQWGHVERGQFT